MAPRVKSSPVATWSATTDKQQDGGTYFIVRPERLRWLDMLRLVFTRRMLRDYPFVETTTPPRHIVIPEQIETFTRPFAVSGSSPQNLVKSKHQQPWDSFCGKEAQNLKEFMTKVYLTIDTFKEGLRRFTNLLSMNNDGAEDFISRVFHGTASIPRSGADERSLIAAIDPRVDPEVYGPHGYLEMSVLASKQAYENEAYSHQVVTNHFQGTHFKFFSCWNMLTGRKTTEAITFARKEGAEMQDVVYVAFRGTELLGIRDWLVNLDCTHILISKTFGSVHQGFMKALGLQHDTDFSKGFPPHLDIDPCKPLAYYSIRAWLQVLLAQLEKDSPMGRKAKVRVVGHSQGGALAILFVALLLYHDWELNAESVEVITMGQPRVGDTTFAQTMMSYLSGVKSTPMPRIEYTRMVYRHDIVPRVPSDAREERREYSRWKHFGTFLYYEGWERRPTRRDDGTDVPNPNYTSSYATMAAELFNDMITAWSNRVKLEENWLSHALRGVGLIIPHNIPVGPGIAFHSMREYLHSAKYASGRHPGDA